MTYDELKAKSICIRCKKARARPNRTCCEECAKRDAKYKANSTAILKAQGICVICKKTNNRQPKVYCLECSEEIKAHRSRLASLGICTRCGNENAEQNRRYCAKCKEINSRQYRAEVARQKLLKRGQVVNHENNSRA